MKDKLKDLLKKMDETDKKICNFKLVFTEILKNEIDAADEQDIYVNVLKTIRKYQNDEKCLEAIFEFFSAISEGANLIEVMDISMEEASDPSPVSKMTIDDTCTLKQKERR